MVVDAGVCHTGGPHVELALAAWHLRLGGGRRHRLHHDGPHLRALRVDPTDRTLPHGSLYESGAADDGSAQRLRARRSFDAAPGIRRFDDDRGVVLVPSTAMKKWRSMQCCATMIFSAA